MDVPHRLWIRCLAGTHPRWEPLPEEHPSQAAAEQTLAEICEDDSDLSGVALPADERPTEPDQ